MSMTSPTTMDLAGEMDSLTVAPIDRELAALADTLQNRVSDMEVAVTLEGRRQALVGARRLAVVKERAQLRQQQLGGGRLRARPVRGTGGGTCFRGCARRRRPSMSGSKRVRGCSPNTSRPPGGSARSTARSAHRRCGANCTCSGSSTRSRRWTMDRTRPREGRRAAGRPVAPRPRVVGDDRELRQPAHTPIPRRSPPAAAARAGPRRRRDGVEHLGEGDDEQPSRQRADPRGDDRGAQVTCRAALRRGPPAPPEPATPALESWTRTRTRSPSTGAITKRQRKRSPWKPHSVRRCSSARPNSRRSCRWARPSASRGIATMSGP